MFFQDMFAMFIYPGNGNNAKTTVHSYVQRTPSRYASSQLSPATIPSSPFRQPSPHHHTLLYKAECFFFLFGSSFSVVSVVASQSQHVLAGAVASLTALAATARHVQSAKKGGPESPPIPGSQTSTPSACPGSTSVA